MRLALDLLRLVLDLLKTVSPAPMFRILKVFPALLLASFIAAWLPSLHAQPSITVTFPAKVAAAPDYATEVLGDAWDMCNPEDISRNPDQRIGFSSFAFLTGPCRAGGTTMPVSGVVDSSITILQPGLYGSALNPGRNGRTFPIDSSRYQVLSYKVNSSAADTPQVYWNHNPTDHPAGPGLGGRVLPVTQAGTQVTIADLTQSLISGFSPWTNGVVQGLRLDPNAGVAVANVFYYWVRLTPAASSPLAAKQNISWSGSGPATISVRDNTDGSVFPVASGQSSPYLWNYGVLPPGSYTLLVTNSTGSGSRNFVINHPPRIDVTDPSPTTGEDYATAVLGNPWDMSDPADVQLTGYDYFTPPSFSGGVMVATNHVNDDPNVTLLFYSNNAVPIDTAKYRYLTYRFQVDGPFDLGLGSVARIYWTSNPVMSGLTASGTLPIIVWEGMNSYTIDMATLATGIDGGIEPLGGSETWAAGHKRHLRFDPHEFPPSRTFRIDDIKLTAKPVANTSYTIRFVGSDGDGDAATVALYRDTDTNPASGRVAIATGIPQNAGQFVWNTSGVPQGEYFIYAESSDGVQSTGRYSTVPILLERRIATPTSLRVVQ
jgi:hypothetical protein